jgi:hypothetical protein
MRYLTKKDENGKTPIDVYVEKQQLWADAQGEWDKAKLKARSRCSGTSELQVQEDITLC